MMNQDCAALQSGLIVLVSGFVIVGPTLGSALAGASPGPTFGLSSSAGL
jgi:hypothetical protein